MFLKIKNNYKNIINDKKCHQDDIKIYEVNWTTFDGELISNKLIARSLNTQFSVTMEQKISKQTEVLDNT